jgi:hypothetical protein
LVSISITDFKDTPKLRSIIGAVSSAKKGETITIELQDNMGGATHMGGELISEIKNSQANIILCIEGTVARTAAFVWSWIHLAKGHGLLVHPVNRYLAS